MNEVQIFPSKEFGDIRTALIDGKEYFCGNDVAGALCYQVPKNAISRHCKGALFWCPSNETQEMKYIPLGDVYRLIVKASSQSNNEEIREKASRFERLVFDEILPQIHKTGAYGQPKLPTEPMELLELHYQALKKVDSKVDSLEERFNKLEADMPVFTIDAKRIQDAVRKKAIEILGGKESNAYKDKSIRTYVFADVQCMLRRNFGVKRYEEIKHRQTDDALRLIEEHKPPLVLKDRVDMMNTQQTLNFGEGGACNG